MATKYLFRKSNMYKCIVIYRMDNEGREMVMVGQSGIFSSRIIKGVSSISSQWWRWNGEIKTPEEYYGY